MKTRLFVVLSLIFLAASAFAEGTRSWEQSKMDELEKGTANGVAIRSDGTLELAPAFKPIVTTRSAYIWSGVAGADGAIYLGAGSPARVYRVTPDGESTVIFESQELQVQALAVGANGVIYAATSPDGKVYTLQPPSKAAAPAKSPARSKDESSTGDTPWNASVFFEPKTKYIWQLALDASNRLYVATGDHGEIFRVSPTGEGTLFFKSDEAHIRTLAFDPKGNLVAGSDSSGLIYRISPTGEAFVLYSAPKKEITALAVDKAGNIFAAGVGDKRPPSAVTSMPPIPPRPAATAPPAAVLAAPGARAATTTAAPAAPVLPPALHATGAVGSEVYEIAPDGSPKQLWSSREEVVYALAFDAQGTLLAGTGNKGRIFAIRSEHQFTDLVKASATQVTAFAKAPSGGVYVCTSNLGKLFLLGGAPEEEGSFQSDVFDAHIFSRWGRAAVRGQGRFELWARSGNVDNPDRNWSSWTQADLNKDTPIAMPPARFVQWKAILRTGTPPAAISSVLLYYLPKNVAPVVDEVVVLTGTRFNSPPRPAGGEIGIGANNAPLRSEPPPTSVRDRTSIGIRWSAHDENDDQLMYALYYRGDQETQWKLLKDKIAEKFYSLDAGLLPDGGYQIKVVASDEPSHSPAEALTGERESARFEVDTTPPRIDNLTASMSGNSLRVSFRASDTFSVIRRAEFSVDAGDWQTIEPIGELSDARTESYQFSVPLATAQSSCQCTTPAISTGRGRQRSTARTADNNMPPVAAGEEHVVVVRVWDHFENMAAAKTVVRGK